VKHTPGQPGYYPGYHTLESADVWDEATRQTIHKRLGPPPPLQFFSTQEAVLLQAVIDRVLPQDDRDAEHTIAILPTIDHRLASGRIEGYRYEDMPPDGEAHRLGLRGIDEIAGVLHHQHFLTLSPMRKDEVLFTIHDAAPPEAARVWRELPADRYWRLLMEDVTAAYYSHPLVWDEIGFGGPAYPRGYMRLDHGQPEPWEKPEHRYEFQAPPEALSGEFRPLGKLQHPIKPVPAPLAPLESRRTARRPSGATRAPLDREQERAAKPGARDE
jgi:hypothetical protein